MSIADLRRQVAEAATGAVEGALDADGTDDTEAATGDASDSSASEEGQSATGSEGTEGESEAGDGTDIPEEYFGYKFPPDLTPEQRGEILTELKKRDDTIGKLLRGKEPVKDGDTPPPEPEPEPEPVTDEDILRALGADPDDPFASDSLKAVVPIVRKQMEQENVIAQLIEIQELNEIDRTWRQSLSGLEKEFGALPAEVSHDDVMEFAAKEGIGNAMDAYWRIVGPGRAAVEVTATEKARALLAAKAASATTRPGGGNVTDETPVKAKTTKGATREAAKRILADMGLGDS